MDNQDLPKQFVQARIIGLKDEAWGLVITAENGPTKIEFATSAVILKRNLRIGQMVRATIEIADA